MTAKERREALFVGSCMRDLVCVSERLPQIGETVHGSQFIAGYGGKGANPAIVAARLGANVSMVAKLGNDEHGPAYVKVFKENGVNTDFVTLTDASHTGVASIFVDSLGRNCIVIVNGANEFLSSEDILNAEPKFENSAVVLTQLETPQETAVATLKLARKHGVKTIFNAAPGTNNLDPQLYELADIFCVNESEAALITDMCVDDLDSAKLAMASLLDRGCALVIITLGENGAIFASKEQPSCVHVQAQRVKAVDTTGAGDAFLGALAYYLTEYKSLPFKDIVKRCCDIATVSVTAHGTHNSYPWKKDLPVTLFQ